jgi:hypothetical protein
VHNPTALTKGLRREILNDWRFETFHAASVTDLMKGVRNMKIMLLAAAGAIAAIAFPAVPACAQDGSFTSGSRSGALVGRPSAPPFGQNGFRSDRRARTDVVMDWYGGQWALYNNRSWAPDSYNDWWHDNPSRAYPAWMQRNQDCARPWFSGDTLRC